MLPFEIIPKHLALKMNLGEVHRWVVLFDKTLSEFVEMKKISSEDKEEWLKKVDIFKNKLIKMLV
jgi:hypothetical protein